MIHNRGNWSDDLVYKGSRFGLCIITEAMCFQTVGKWIYLGEPLRCWFSSRGCALYVVYRALLVNPSCSAADCQFANLIVYEISSFVIAVNWS